MKRNVLIYSVLSFLVLAGAIFMIWRLTGSNANKNSEVEKNNETAQIKREQTITVNGVSFKMIYVEGGTFTMGCTSEQGGDCIKDEKPTHQVTVSSYSIGETEVTQALWKAVMGSVPIDGHGWNTIYGLGDNIPAYCVSWIDVQRFIRELNRMTGRTFRLPTEAEWEYAARGGNKSKEYKYSGSNEIGEVAWSNRNIEHGTHSQPVKTKKANELGIYDMSGNVWEWCEDVWYSYDSSAKRNPYFDSYHVTRGGSWGHYPSNCRVSYRASCKDLTYDFDLGFRLVLVQ